MKKITLVFCSLLVSFTAFAFESYKDSAVLTNEKIAEYAINIAGYRNVTMTDDRGFEYSGYVETKLLGAKGKDYLQLGKFTNDKSGKYSWLKLPEVGFPIEEIVLSVGSSSGEDAGVENNRTLFFIKQNYPDSKGKFVGGVAQDTVAANVYARQNISGLRQVSMKIDPAIASTGYLISVGNGGFRIYDIKLKWTVSHELNATKIELLPDMLDVAEGKTADLTLKAQPINHTETIVWKSLDESVATVADGKVEAKAVGVAKIVATTSTSELSDTCTVTVHPKATAMHICYESTPIDTLEMRADVVGSIYDVEFLTTSFDPAGALPEMVSWQSSKPAVATVNENGRVEAVTPGETLVFATSESGLKDTILVIVKGKLMPEQVVINQQELSFEVGDYTTLEATVLPEELPEELKEVSWSSLNNRVATVSARGFVEAVGSGTTYIVASTYNGLSDSCLVRVGGTPVSGEYFVKVTTEPENWEGKYLFVYENGSLAMDGSLTEFDVAANTKEVEIQGETIEADASTKAISFDIRSMGNDQFSVQSASGKFIGYNAAETQYQNKNGLQTSNTPLANSLEFADGIAKIFGADGSRLMYNTDETASGKKLLFRYYQNADNAILVAPQLYRYIGSETAIYNVELTGIYSENGRILGAENLQIFTVSGINVTHENGRLSGIYIVKSGEKIAKIAVK